MPETDETQETAETETETTEEELGDGGKKALDAEREARRRAEKQLRDAQKSLNDLTAKVKQFEDAGKSEQQKLQDQLDQERAAREAAEKRAAAAERTEYGLDKGLPRALAKRLTGTTPDELDAEIEELLPLVSAGDKAPPKRNPASSGGGLKSGASGKENTNPDPKAHAAEMLRRMRSGG